MEWFGHVFLPWLTGIALVHLGVSILLTVIIAVVYSSSQEKLDGGVKFVWSLFGLCSIMYVGIFFVGLGLGMVGWAG
jgi:hypothetical protein